MVESDRDRDADGDADAHTGGPSGVEDETPACAGPAAPCPDPGPFIRAFQNADFPIALTEGVPPFACVYMNPAFEASTGIRLEQMRGHSLRSLQSDLLQPGGSLSTLRSALQDGRAAQVLLRNRHPDGQPFDNQLTVVPIHGSGEAPDFFLGVQRDVTAERQAQERIEEERALLEEAERIARCGTWMWDIETEAVTWSPGIYALVGRPRQAGPMPLTEQRALYREHYPALRASIRAAAQRGQPYALDLVLHPVVGPPFWAHARGRRATTRDGRQQLIGTLQAIEERKAQEQALSEARDRALAADKAKSAFLATMSHEIRTPLNGVIGAASLLEAQDFDTETRELLHTIRTSGEALLEVLGDVLDHSKLEAGQLELEAHPVEVEPLLEEVAQLFLARAHEKRDVILLEIPPGAAALVEGDGSRLRQILSNLVSNAVKFTREGTIRMGVGSGPGFELWVEDEGIGITEEAMGRLFQPFVQADGSTHRRFGGTGLGLSISRRLAERMGGTIEVASEAGRGSRFTFTAPLPVLDRPPRARRLEGLDVAIEGSGPGELRVRALLDSEGAILHPEVAPVRERSAAKVRVVLHDGMDASTRPTSPGELHVWPGPPPAGRGGYHLSVPLRRDAFVENVLEAAGSALPPSRQGAMAPPGLSVLVVDDNAVNRLVAERMLKRLGAKVTVATGGLEAVEQAFLEDFDLILMDVQMPEVDGYEATRRIRAAGRAKIPIVALTAGALVEDRQAALDRGLDAHLAKPVRLDDLRRLLERLPTLV